MESIRTASEDGDNDTEDHLKLPGRRSVNVDAILLDDSSDDETEVEDRHDNRTDASHTIILLL